MHLLTAFLFIGFSAFTIDGGPKETKRNVNKDVLPFIRGEQLDYSIRYGFVKAGEVQLKVSPATNRNGKPVYHMVGTGRTTGMTDWFFRTRDRYETYMDAETMFPIEFIRDVDEGGYKIKRHIFFNQEEKTAYDAELKEDTTFSLPATMQDIFSAFYYARSLDMEDIAPGEMISIDVFLDHEYYDFRIKYLGTELVKTNGMYINCMKFMPVVQKGRVFKDKETMTIWISNDPNRIPVRLKAELAVGSIKADLNTYSNLAHPLNRLR